MSASVQFIRSYKRYRCFGEDEYGFETIILGCVIFLEPAVYFRRVERQDSQRLCQLPLQFTDFCVI